MQHLEEGTIHAWLDGALSVEEAERVERHANECADCAALVAEARGLVAGASRILSALDDVPGAVPFGLGGTRGAGAGTALGQIASRRPQPSVLRPRWWSRPAALAAAAGLVLMAGSAIVLNRTGGRASLGAFADSMQVSVPTTEAEAPVAEPVSSRPLASAGAQAFSKDGRGAGADAAVLPPAPAPPARQSVLAAKKAERGAAESRAPTAPREVVANVQRRDSVVRLDQQVVPTTGASAGRAATQKAQQLSEKAVPAPPPSPADMAADQRAQEAAPPAAVAPSIARRAAPPRARAERALSSAAAAAELPGRVDTVYLEPKVDTIVVDPPENPRYRPRGGVVGAMRAFTATGCYRVLQSRVPRPITLTGDPVWRGAAEHGFVATAPGARGYWSQPKTGDIHIVVDRWVVTARIDPSTGELRGTAQRGRTKEAFLAKRGC